MNSKVKLLIALALPISILLGMTLYNQYLLSTRPEYVPPIEGYDPRDLLAGNYIRFRIKYSIPRKCNTTYYAKAYICMKPEQKIMPENVDSNCQEWITGKCHGGEFYDELDRYYIPQERASMIEKEVRTGKATIKLSVGQGEAVIKDLLIDGKSWTSQQ